MGSERTESDGRDDRDRWRGQAIPQTCSSTERRERARSATRPHPRRRLRRARRGAEAGGRRRRRRPDRRATTTTPSSRSCTSSRPGLLEPTAVGHSLRDLVHGSGQRAVHKTSVTAIDLEAREVQLAEMAPLDLRLPRARARRRGHLLRRPRARPSTPSRCTRSPTRSASRTTCSGRWEAADKDPSLRRGRRPQRRRRRRRADRGGERRRDRRALPQRLRQGLPGHPAGEGACRPGRGGAGRCSRCSSRTSATYARRRSRSAPSRSSPASASPRSRPPA